MQKHTCIDTDKYQAQAKEVKPKMIDWQAQVAYARIIDFKRLREIADEVGCYADGRYGAYCRFGCSRCSSKSGGMGRYCNYNNPQNIARSQRQLILCKEEYAKAIDKAIFPGIQGGPLMHVIAGKAVCLGEALKPEFKEYGKRVVENAQALANGLTKRGVKLVSRRYR